VNGQGPARAMLAIVLAVVAAAAGAARADEMDGWCAQVKKASSVVICSDPELRQQALGRNKLFEAVREKLSPEVYKALTADQTHWVKAYTARCGISTDGPVPTLPVPPAVIDCYRRESRARTAELTSRFSGSTTIPPSQSSVGESSAAAAIAAGRSWTECLFAAVDALSAQPEPARTVADAAFGSCLQEEGKYRSAIKAATDRAGLFEEIKTETITPKVLARVMASRRAQQDAGTKGTTASPPSAASDADLDKWIQCTLIAVDALADQSEPAQTVANAVFGSCLNEQLAYQKSARLSDQQLEADKTAILAPRVLAQVMAVRAARTKLRKENPETKPAIDYNRM
jgi:uncharacterized protein YecT (DUF1311 family)